MKPKLVVIGASYLQRPLILKARELGIETHAFAWEEGAVAKKDCDHFYPISITNKEMILSKAKEIRANGVATIASDLAASTVTYVATHMGLVSNSEDATQRSTNKYLMRETLSRAGLPCPKFVRVRDASDADAGAFTFPLLVKPTDRSGSRGVTKVENAAALSSAIERALGESLEKCALVEEFVDGREISVEMISWNGQHHFLAITDKQTSGAPYFVEIGHDQPSSLPPAVQEDVLQIVTRALTALGITHGASHSELLIRDDGKPYIVEIGGRMGGDFIGSDLVELSTGYDFLQGVIEVALGNFSKATKTKHHCSGIRYLTAEQAGTVRAIEDECGGFPEILRKEIFVRVGDTVRVPRESAERSGYFIYSGEARFSPVELPLRLTIQPS